MKRAPSFPTTPHGASTLDEDGQKWFLERTGQRYRGVQWDSDRPSRRQRRAGQHRKRDLG